MSCLLTSLVTPTPEPAAWTVRNAAEQLGTICGRFRDATTGYVPIGDGCRVWLFNSLGNIIRGTGNMAVPAAVNCVGAAVLIPLSPCLIFGWGPFPRLAIMGGAVAVVGFYALGALALTLYLLSSRSLIQLSIRRFTFRWSLFHEILRVGAVAALITVGTKVTIAVATGLIGQFGPAAIAGSPVMAPARVSNISWSRWCSAWAGRSSRSLAPTSVRAIL